MSSRLSRRAGALSKKGEVIEESGIAYTHRYRVL